jgi:S-adenosylmethionine:tRNA ribosyltransferase-isomerase
MLRRVSFLNLQHLPYLLNEICMHPKLLSIQDFTYTLPEEKIAAHPLPQRDQSKLLVWKNNAITEDIYRNIAAHIPGGSLLLFNNTKVVQARIFFKKPTGGVIEIFVLEPVPAAEGLHAAMQSRERVSCKCLIGGAGKWKHGRALQKQASIDGTEVFLEAAIRDRTPENFVIEFSWQPGTLTFIEILHLFGEMPIPPYLKRAADASDNERYQTLYAKHEGSVAAPTAGLHFTEQVFQSLEEKNIRSAFLTLHVGAGTFMPVKSNTMEGHHMHAEYMEINLELINMLVNNTAPVITVGTTAVRTVESLYWMGVKCFYQPGISSQDLEMKQWEVYEFDRPLPDAADALRALATWMQARETASLAIQTRIIIAPTYKPRIVSGLVTNFHQPNSTLLLLVAALIGENWKQLYAYALSHDFRFLSYGDGCLLLF